MNVSVSISSIGILLYLQKKASKYIGTNDPPMLLYGKSYKVKDIERGWFRIIDETGEDYLYPPELFKVITK